MIITFDGASKETKKETVERFQSLNRNYVFIKYLAEKNQKSFEFLVVAPCFICPKALQ
jgi:hypothetical protein